MTLFDAKNLTLPIGGKARASSAARAKRQVSLHSGGRAQRVIPARGLPSEPSLPVLDKATHGRGRHGTALFCQQIDVAQQRRSCGALQVSHDLHVGRNARDRVICLDGQNSCQGALIDVALAPEYRAPARTSTKGALALYPHRYGSQDTTATEAEK